MPESDPIDPGRAPIEQSGEPTRSSLRINFADAPEATKKALQEEVSWLHDYVSTVEDIIGVEEAALVFGGGGYPTLHIRWDGEDRSMWVDMDESLAARLLDDERPKGGFDTEPAPQREGPQPVGGAADEPVTPVAHLLVSEVVAFLAGLTLGLLIGWVVL